MYKFFYSLLLVMILAFSTHAQVANVIWDHNYGSWDMDLCRGMAMSVDSGFFMVGTVPPVVDSNDISGHHGNGQTDGWIMKTDKNGVLLWKRCLGGNASDLMHGVHATADSGCIVIGYGKSNDGDLANIPHHTLEDIYVIKLSSAGDIQWLKCIGGSLGEEGRCITGTPDGGYLIGGMGQSNDGDVSGNHGSGDIILVKLNDTGGIEWQKCLGGTNAEHPTRLRPTSDGGYIMAGYSGSSDGDVSMNYGDFDWWIVKVNADGDITWEKSFGGSGLDQAYDARETPDGGYIAVGMTASTDGDVTASHGNYEGWVVKTDATGGIEWQRAYGGSLHEGFNMVGDDGSGGYFISGHTRSDDGDVNPPTHGNPDYWFVHVDSVGNLITRTCLGGVDPDGSVGFAQTSDGCIVMGGMAGWASHDVSNNYGYGADFWLVKFQQPVSVPELYKKKTDILVSNIPGDGTYVQLPEGCEQAQLSVLDMHGRKMLASISGSSLNRKVSITGLHVGIYILQVSIGREIYNYSISR